MITWIRENIVLASALAGLIGVISTVAVTRYQISSLVAAQPEIERHMNDTTRHLDPVRDFERQKQLEARIQTLEDQLRRVEARRMWQGQRDDRRRER